jgi:hypothetical protein
LDWKGSSVSFFITEDGHVTDGGQILSQLKSLRVIEDFKVWAFKDDFLERSCIQQRQGRLEPINNDDPSEILRYIQGITRLPNFFEPNPIYSTKDKFPPRVKQMTVEALIPHAPSNFLDDERRLWAGEFTRERAIPLNGINVQSDMSPKKYFRMVQIISHATSGKSDRKQHVESKILAPVLLKRQEPKADWAAIVEDLSAYPSESRVLLKKESEDNIMETKEADFGERITEFLMEA